MPRLQGNNATGSSPIAGGNGFNFAQHLYLARNDVRNVRGNDREVMTYDAEGAQYAGPPTLINATHVVSPNCPGRMDSRFDPTNAFNSAPRGGVIAILDGPGAGLYRRVVGWGATGAPTNYDTAPCWWAIDRPFPDALGAANTSAMSMVVTFFAGRSLFVGNTFADTGHFQLYHSGIENVLSGTTMARMGGAWAGGMSVGIRNYLNNSAGPLAPNPTLFSEFTDNAVAVGHRAPHACDPDHMNRSTFWACSPQHAMASFGMDGQDGDRVANRFMVFSRNRINGANGVLLWGLGNKDALVAQNSFTNVERPIIIDQFPAGHDTVANFVIYNNSMPPARKITNKRH